MILKSPLVKTYMIMYNMHPYVITLDHTVVSIVLSDCVLVLCAGNRGQWTGHCQRNHLCPVHQESSEEIHLLLETLSVVEEGKGGSWKCDNNRDNGTAGLSETEDQLC